MTDTTTTPAVEFVVGDRCTLKPGAVQADGRPFRLEYTEGDVFVVTNPKDGDGDAWLHAYGKPTGTNGYVRHDLLVPLVEESKERPLIDFGTEARSTAREYAAALLSKRLSDDDAAVLRRIAAGEAVDAYEVARAVQAATRAALTRWSASTERRQAGKQAAHLAYIAHAVLSNHADGLPVYQAGERSPLIRQHEATIRELRAENERLVAERDDLAAERERLLEPVAEPKLQADEALVEALNRSLNYAVALLDDDTKVARLLGFIDGVSPAQPGGEAQ